MRSSEECVREAVTVQADASCIDVADEMDANGVGCVVVVDGVSRPVGIVTDRDLMVRVISSGRDPEKTLARDVMTAEPTTGTPADGVEELLATMQSQGIRRIPLVDGDRLIGLLTLDDLIMELSSQLFNVSEAVWVGLRESRRTARPRRRREARDDAIEELRHQVLAIRDQTRSQAAAMLEGLASKLRP